MSRFADLIPNTSSRYIFWEEQYPFIRELLLEIDRDILAGRGWFKENIFPNTDASRGVLLPNILLHIEPWRGMSRRDKFIYVSVGQENNSLRVLSAEGDGDYYNNKGRDIRVEQLEAVLREMIAGWINQGELLSWRGEFHTESGVWAVVGRLIGTVDNETFNIFALHEGTALFQVGSLSSLQRPIQNWYPRYPVVETMKKYIEKGDKFETEQYRAISAARRTMELQKEHPEKEFTPGKFSFRLKGEEKYINLLSLPENTEMSIWAPDGTCIASRRWYVEPENTRMWLHYNSLGCRVSLKD